MNKSLLKLLEAEDRAFYDIKFSKESAIDFLNQAKESNNINDKETCERLALEYEENAIKAEEELLQIRKELKNYIAYIQTL